VRPLAVDLCSGLGGWACGLEAEGWDVIRVDIADMFAETGTPKPDPCLLMVQDILTFHGRQARHAALIVASPPCQEFSYRAMPWKRAKALAPEEIGVDVPTWWSKPEGKMDAAELAEWQAWKRDHPKPPPSLALVEACFRIQREASEAAGHHIPMVLENVKGMQRWFGRARWSFGSFFLWGDVPALMPPIKQRSKRDRTTLNKDGYAIILPQVVDRRLDDSATKVPGFRFDGSGRSFQTASVNEGRKHDGSGWRENGTLMSSNRMVPSRVPEGLKHGGDWFSDPSSPSSPSRQGGQKAPAKGWFNDSDDPKRMAMMSSKSPARKRASAMIAKIPESLARHIARVSHPRNGALTGNADRD